MPDLVQPDSIYQTIVDWSLRGLPFAVATVLQAEGSTPCKAGARMVINGAGDSKGTIGGGAVEAETQRRALAAIQRAASARFEFRMEGDALGATAPLCGGIMWVLIDAAAARHRSAYAAAAHCQETGQRGVLLTILRGSDPCDVEVRYLESREVPAIDTFPGAATVLAIVKREEAQLVVAGTEAPHPELAVFVEPLLPRPRLLVAGGGHVGQAVAQCAAWAGFSVVVIDDRPEFTRPERFPEGVVTRCAPIAAELAAFARDPDTYIVIVTRGHQHDAQALEACLKQPAAYVGMIGSRRKVALLRDEFITSGRATAEAFDQVYTPIGLNIGAVTVPEIAVSVVAQMIAVRRRGTASRIPIR